MRSVRFILDLNNDPILRAEWKEYEQKSKAYTERLTFLGKQINSLQDEIRITGELYWKDLELELEKRDLLNGYDHKKSYLQVNPDTLQLFEIPRSESGLPSLADLFKD
jgi:hypothetical protein